MRLLFVSATFTEVAPLVASMKHRHEKDQRLKSYSYNQHEIDLLLTGPGMTATAYWLGRTLARYDYDAAFNFGICGSFDRTLKLGDVLHIASDRFAELGAEDGEKFLSINEIGLIGENEFPFLWGQLVNQTNMHSLVLNELPRVSGITVNTASGHEPTIAYLKQRFRPIAESMEGAAFLYGCLTQKLPCAQIRAVSNFVERRNRDAWRIDVAIRSLNAKAIEILKSF